MSKIQDVPFITKVIETLSDELKSGLYDLIDGQVKTPAFRSLVNNDYAITESNDKGKVQFVTLETLRGNYTGYLAYNSVYCVLIAFKGNTQALDMLNINVAKHTFAFVNESLSILELRVELEDGKEGVTPTDLKNTNNNIHLSKGTTQIGEGINLKTLDGNTLIGSGDIDLKTVGGETIVGSGNVGFKTINSETLIGSGNIVVGDTGTVDGALDDDSVNPVQNKVVTNALSTKLALPATAPATRKVVTIDTNGAQENVDSTSLTTLMGNIVDSDGNARFVEGNITVNEIEGVTQTYGKWSLSGTHLMIVLSLDIASGAEFTNGQQILAVELPVYIANKITAIFPNYQVDLKKFTAYDNEWNEQPFICSLQRASTWLAILKINNVTLSNNKKVRIQFDLLIDSD